MIWLLLWSCAKPVEVASLYPAPIPPMDPPTIEAIEPVPGCSTRATAEVRDGCSFAVVPSWRILTDEQHLAVGDWWQARAEICQDHRTLDRAFADDAVMRMRQDNREMRRVNLGLRMSVAAGVAGGLVLGVPSAALAAWLLGEATP